MILAIPEYDDYPASPAQWDRFYHTVNDKIYIQTLATTDLSYPTWAEMSEGAAVRDDMRQEIALTRSQYSAKDYQTFLDETFAYISENWGDSFNDFIASEPAIMIAEYMSAAFDQLSWYLDREIDDHYMELSRVRGNVARLAKWLGYKPAPAVAASATLTVTLDDGPYGFDVSLAAGHRFEGPNGLVFELDSSQVISAGNTTKDIGVYQGESFTEVFISTGDGNQEFNLSLVPVGQSVALEKTVVVVDLDTWTEEDFLPYGNDESYEVSYLTNPPKLRFGDGVIGKVPPAGKEIRVSYVATSGKGSGFATSGTIATSLDTVVVNFQQIPISVTNAAPASGGFDAETMEETKANAPRYFLAADRLVTQQDYESIAGGYEGVAGGVSKANAVVIRNVENDLELKALMDALTADRSSLDGYLTAIEVNQNEIKALTGSALTSDTLRNLLVDIGTQTTSVRSSTNDIDSLVTTVEGNIAACVADIESAQTVLDFMPFQEMVGMGNGSQTIFAKTLAKTPITAGSLTVVVNNPTPSKSATDGDCDTTPGRLSSATIGFVSTDKGRLLRIGGEYRQIIKIISAVVVEYSGPRIYGTSLLVDVFPPAIVGYDDAIGNVTGNGLSGTINYTSGIVSMTFTSPPEGISGNYGVPILTSYQYEADGIKTTLDNAVTDAGLASTNVSIFSTYGDTIDGYVDTVDTDVSSIGDLADEIDTEATDTIDQVALAAAIPDQIQDDIDATYTYLGTVISGECKANIVRVSILTKDANGFYTGPSVALINAVKDYLDARKIQTVQNSVVSGSFYLVKVKLNIDVKVLDQYTFQTVSANISAGIDAMLKDRDYAQPLLRSEYYDVVDDVSGVDYSNITISDVAYDDSSNTDTPPAVDGNGNLFIDDHEMITKWEVTITQIAAN